jgi:hypothetical protein
MLPEGEKAKYHAASAEWTTQLAAGATVASFSMAQLGLDAEDMQSVFGAEDDDDDSDAGVCNDD